LKKNPSQKRAGGEAQDVGPEFKPQYHQKKVAGSKRCRQEDLEFQASLGNSVRLCLKTLEAHACNPSYLEGFDHLILSPAWANSS
jgi:hypothetical protein